MIQFESLYKEVFDVLRMKRKDMFNQGVGRVTEQQIWNYFLEKKWSGERLEELHLHSVVSELFAINAEQFKIYLALEKDQSRSKLARLEEKEVESLLKKEKEGSNMSMPI